MARLVETVQFNIEKENRKFRKANKERKRIMIIKDALAQLKSGKYKPESAYFDVSKVHENKIDACDRENSKEVQKLLATLPSCFVCAKGALFISTVRLGNSYIIGPPEILTPRELIARDVQTGVLMNKYFSKETLKNVESVFEGWHEGWTYLKKYNLVHKSKKSILIHILEKMLKNKGEFDING